MHLQQINIFQFYFQTHFNIKLTEMLTSTIQTYVIKFACFFPYITSFLKPGMVIFELNAVDLDDASKLSYQFDPVASTSSYSTYFTIDNGNIIQLKTEVDLDPPVNAEVAFDLVVIVQDDGSPALSGTTTVYVRVSAENEFTPEFNAPYSISVSIYLLINTLYIWVLPVGLQ